jgi:hypothetical protein
VPNAEAEDSEAEDSRGSNDGEAQKLLESALKDGGWRAGTPAIIQVELMNRFDER